MSKSEEWVDKCFFFFKQKTAYELRISDWSSDVCSSDLGLAHHDRDLAARVADSRRPPFAAVDDIIVAVALDPRLDIGRVGRGDRGLGPPKGRTDLAIHDRLQPALLLPRGPIAV